ncbi:MAG: peptidoglycan-binding protein, partial [Catalinimonas sp.]
PRILVIPFDPYLYFSDADEEIAQGSNLPRPEVRHYFRRRLNVLLTPPGYDAIHLLGGTTKDSLADLDRIYKSVRYNYQDILNAEAGGIEVNKPEATAEQPTGSEKVRAWWEQQRQAQPTVRDRQARREAFGEGRYFGVSVRDPAFFDYFERKYDVEYYLFINQFEVKTDYENCLDRAANDYERHFLVHFSVFDAEGKQVAGNKVKVYYHSSADRIQRILADNMPPMADAIIRAVPAPN